MRTYGRSFRVEAQFKDIPPERQEALVARVTSMIEAEVLQLKHPSMVEITVATVINPGQAAALMEHAARVEASNPRPGESLGEYAARVARGAGLSTDEASA